VRSSEFANAVPSLPPRANLGTATPTSLVRFPGWPGRMKGAINCLFISTEDLRRAALDSSSSGGEAQSKHTEGFDPLCAHLFRFDIRFGMEPARRFAP